ncbi:MAG: adoMet-dependent rRNA methyltransferase spb1 [Monoraphidium minutum]|nr:MAG: adoMet-dependent rRNA methyltransferase spb1 [Monoraphidium minutum]
MAKKAKKGKGRLDKYYHLAKEQGFRSRAAFKLIQLNRKYGFLSGCRALLDLCAAPGGWMQVAAKNMPLSSLILGIDLAPIKAVRGCRSIVGDITTAAARQAIKREAGGSLFDVVLHDGAPNVGGAWASEAYTQSILVLESLRLATEFLAPKGTFVTKVFRSKDYNALLYAFGQLFDKVDATKPAASRNASAEIFVVCLGYKAPAKIDARLLDPKHLFKEVDDTPKVMGPEALLKMKIKQKRHREGYDDGLSTSHKAAAAATFLLSEQPVELLGRLTTLVLDGPEATRGAEGAAAAAAGDAVGRGGGEAVAAAVRAHPATTAEVRALMSDLQVLGRSEFKHLLRWRLTLRKDLKPLIEGADADAGAAGGAVGAAGAAAGEGGEGSGGEEGEKDPEAALLAEMSAVKESMDARLKRERRKRREAKKKARVRTAQYAAGAGAGDDGAGMPDDERMFTLSDLPGDAAKQRKRRKGDALAGVAEAAAPGDDLLEALEVDSDDDSGGSESSESSDDDGLAYERRLEEDLERSYEEYVSRRGDRAAAAREKRSRLRKGGELSSEDEADAGGAASDSGASEDDGAYEAFAAARDAAEEAEARKGAGLLVRLEEGRGGVAKGGAAAAAQWFGQDVFDDPNILGPDDSDEEGEGEEEAGQQQQKGRPEKGKKGAAAAAGGKAKRGPGAAAAAPAEAPAKRARGGGGGGAAGLAAAPAAEEEGADLSVDPDSEEADSDLEEFEGLDDQGRAEVLALAKRMLRRKDKETIMDAAYNRYTFHDTGLPKWFAEDERRAMRPIPMVTKAEVEAQKAEMMAINARPIKKVMEAKARKRKRVQAKLDSARQKANSIASQEDVPMASKMREIEKLYAKARAGGGAKKGKKDGKRKGPPLDKRMLKDRRGAKKAERRGGGGGKKGKGGAGGGGGGGGRGKGKGRAGGGGGGKRR